MAEGRAWRAVATIEVDGTTAAPVRLGTSAAVTIGRSPRAGLLSPSPRIEVPRELARLRCTRAGWMLENEGSTAGRLPKPVRVAGPSIRSPHGATFQPRAWILLDRGDWTLEWDVGVAVIVRLTAETTAHAHLEVAVDDPRAAQGMATIAQDPISLTALQRRQLAALFAYLIRGEDEPETPYLVAARLLESDPAAQAHAREVVKSSVFPNVRRKVNSERRRWGLDGLRTLDEVGRYLVDVTGTLGADDLED